MIRFGMPGTFGWPTPDWGVWVTLRWDEHDPYAVALDLTDERGTARWEFGRDLLADAYMHGFAGSGDVRLAVIGGALWLRLMSPNGRAVVKLPARPVLRWLERTYDVVPRGAERYDISDAAITELLLAEGGQ